ncbi:hypothetical protein C0J52_22282 [Blattella germanica]|nr:hypothetical protein C0J52_22282 [Blattella germanica]
MDYLFCLIYISVNNGAINISMIFPGLRRSYGVSVQPSISVGNRIPMVTPNVMGPPLARPGSSRPNFGSSNRGKKQTPSRSSSSRLGGTRGATTGNRTPRSALTSTTDDSRISNYVVALTEGRGHARGEVGMAALEITYPHLILCQISDNQEYINTLRKINVFNPVEIVVPNTFCIGPEPNLLYKCLLNTFPSVTVTSVLRRHFSDTLGLQQIHQLCAHEYSSVEIVVSHKFENSAAVGIDTKFKRVQFKQLSHGNPEPLPHSRRNASSASHHFGTASLLPNFNNIDHLMTLSMHIPEQDNLQVAEYQMKYTLQLKCTLELLPKVMADERFPTILNRILAVIHQDARTAKGASASEMQRNFAIKAGVSELLDLSRQAYCEIVGSISTEKHHLPLKVKCTGNWGFHIELTLGKRQLKKEDLPSEFVQVSQTKKKIVKSSTVIIHQIVVICGLLSDIRGDIGCIFKLCEMIAELDMLTSFANLSSLNTYVRPQFGTNLDLKQSRHPILDNVLPRVPVSNDVSKEFQYIGQMITPTSLIIVDELCRGTSCEEGTAVAWAIVEELLQHSAYIFITTHFLYLTKLQELYYNVVNEHFEALEDCTESGRERLIYTHKLLSGVTQIENYGLRLARGLAFPETILENAALMTQKISSERKTIEVTEIENTDFNNILYRYSASQSQNDIQRPCLSPAEEPMEVEYEENRSILRTPMLSLPTDVSDINPFRTILDSVDHSEEKKK